MHANLLSQFGQCPDTGFEEFATWSTTIEESAGEFIKVLELFVWFCNGWKAHGTALVADK